MRGNPFGLARWFDEARYANAPEDNYIRENVLNDIENFEAVGELSLDAPTTLKHYIVRTPLGAATIQHVTTYEDYNDVDLVVFDHVRNDRWERIDFWFNASSVSDLLDRLEAAPHVNADSLFIGGTR